MCSEPEFWKYREEWAPQKQWLGSFHGSGHFVGKRQERWGVLSWCLPEEPVLTAAGMRAGSCSNGGERKPHISPLPLTWLGQPLGVAPWDQEWWRRRARDGRQMKKRRLSSFFWVFSS